MRGGSAGPPGALDLRGPLVVEGEVIERSGGLSAASGLEQLDRVAGGVLQEDLLPAGAADDVVAEGEACGAQPLDLGRDVLDDQVDAVPAAGFGRAPVGHRSPG